MFKLSSLNQGLYLSEPYSPL